MVDISKKRKKKNIFYAAKYIEDKLIEKLLLHSHFVYQFVIMVCPEQTFDEEK